MGISSPRVKWLSRGWARPGTHFARERTAAFLRNHRAAQQALEPFDLVERNRVSFVEQATRNPQVEADQIGRVQAEVGEPPALGIVDGNQVCQPMDALEDDPRGPGGQKRRSGLRSARPPQMRMSGNFEVLRNISLTVE